MEGVCVIVFMSSGEEMYLNIPFLVPLSNKKGRAKVYSIMLFCTVSSASLGLLTLSA